ncbi:hypothetical protein NQ314_002591 [Rhamnusium bicolor]|uniref:Regucalcin n=1 Tax=Rhamnusium bicolor TaxID=1586634 RepID=A0AAV8ZQV9_9CUCU|nr:hypothetical protein NQ314_002591 [Rhamnusium bicolor]
MTPKIERIVEDCILAEGPHWDEENQCLYFVDMRGTAIYKYVYETKKYTKASTGGKHVSIIIPVKGQKNKFIVTLDREINIINWDGESDKIIVDKKIAEVENNPDTTNLKFNDGKCDPSGRLWVGNRTDIFTLAKHDISGCPDGMAIDVDGNLWIAIFGGSRIIKIDPRTPESLLDSFSLPAKQITSVAFGGPNLDELFVTSARLPTSGEELLPPDNDIEMTPKIERIVENCELAEGPHWDEETQALYFVDIPGKAIYKYVPATKKITKASTGLKHVSLIIPIKGQKDKFLVTLDRELSVISWDGESDKITVDEVITEIENNPETIHNRFNDGKCDPSGRLWAGSISLSESGEFQSGNGSFYSFEKNKVTKFISGVTISNGIAFITERKKMYYIDSPKQTIDELDFDIVNGTVANRNPIFTLARHDIPGSPDGMTIDTDGNLWVALFGGSRVIKIDPRKSETHLDTIRLPAKQITSVAFGGPNLDELYVTSGRLTIGGEELLPPDNGAVFKITGLNARGLPGVSAVL